MSHDGGREKSGMLPVEKRAAGSLAAIFGLRMLGLFMLLPILALYAEDLEGSTPLLMGLALGIYGLTQALLQIPFGMLSDRYGRKIMIAIGLLIFAVGSVVAAMATTIEGVILGRAIQGAGAIAAATMALLADLTREEFRTKAMATFGITIGMSFTLAIVLGPILNSFIGVSGIFWLTGILALLALVVLYKVVPTPTHLHMHHDAECDIAQCSSVLKEGELLRLNFGIFVLHLILTAIFVVIPIGLVDSGLVASDHWMVYLGVVVLAMGIMVPLVIQAESKGKMKEMFTLAIALVILSQLTLLQFSGSLWGIVIALIIFFGGFNLLEATLPSLISKIAPVDKKGTAMGIYTSSQFFGAFLGGVSGGWIYGWFDKDITPIFLLSAGLATVWLMIALGMKRPQVVRTHLLNVGEVGDDRAAEMTQKLREITGVIEVVIIRDDQVAYVKANNDLEDRKVLEEVIATR